MWDFSQTDVTFDLTNDFFDGSISGGGFAATMPTIRYVLTSACQAFSACQFAGSTNIAYELDVSLISLMPWSANSAMVANQFIRPNSGNETGYVYQNDANPGQSGPEEPGWPTPAGVTVQDGSVTWTAAIPPAIGQDTIQSATWVQQSPPDGVLVVSGVVNTGLTTSAFVGGGTTGQKYTILIEITMVSGATYPVEIVVTID